MKVVTSKTMAELEAQAYQQGFKERDFMENDMDSGDLDPGDADCGDWVQALARLSQLPIQLT